MWSDRKSVSVHYRKTEILHLRCDEQIAEVLELPLEAVKLVDMKE